MMPRIFAFAQLWRWTLTFSWLLILPLRITKKGRYKSDLFRYWSGQWDWLCRCVLVRQFASPAYSSLPLVLVGPTTSTLATKKIIPKVAVMGILSRYFYGYWYVFAHRRHYQLWYRFQYILDFCTLYIWQLDQVLLCFFTDRKGISHIKHFYAGFYLVMSETFL